MKITILAGAFLPIPPVQGGAVERIQYHLAEEFAAAGHTVTIVSRRFSGLPKFSTENRVVHKRIWSSDRVLSRHINLLIDAIYTLIARLAVPVSDIIVTNTFFAPFFMPLRSGKIFVHVARTPKGQMRYYGRAARLQGVSKDVAEQVKVEAPSLSDRVRAIPNPLAPFFFGDEPPTRTSERERVVLYVGRIAREKGLSILLDGFAEAVKRLGPQAQKWTLKVVGPHSAAAGGDGQIYLDELRSQADRSGVCCQFPGPVYDPTVLLETYRSAPIFVYPSVSEAGETFGMSPLEAMASGAAVVVSGLSCFDEFIRNGQNAISFAHNASNPTMELASALVVIMADTEIADTLGANGRETAMRFHLKEVAKLYLNDFHELLEG